MQNPANHDGRDVAADGEATAEDPRARAARLAEIARPTARDRTKAWQSHIDQAIAEAAERGAFDDLPGKGKPLTFDTDVDDDMWLANHMLKGQGFRPAWIERIKEIAADHALIAARVDSFLADWTAAGATDPDRTARDASLARVEADLTARVAAVNRKIDAHNLDVAVASLQRRRLSAADVIAGLRMRLGA